MKFNVEIVYSGLYDCSANVDLVVEDSERRRAEGHRTAQIWLHEHTIGQAT